MQEADTKYLGPILALICVCSRRISGLSLHNKEKNHCGEVNSMWLVGVVLPWLPKVFPQGRFSHRKSEKFVIGQRLLSV